MAQRVRSAEHALSHAPHLVEARGAERRAERVRIDRQRRGHLLVPSRVVSQCACRRGTLLAYAVVATMRHGRSRKAGNGVHDGRRCRRLVSDDAQAERCKACSLAVSGRRRARLTFARRRERRRERAEGERRGILLRRQRALVDCGCDAPHAKRLGVRVDGGGNAAHERVDQ